MAQDSVRSNYLNYYRLFKLINPKPFRIKSNRMFGRFFTLMVGFYGGIYVDQNYDLPRVGDPKEILSKIEKFMENYRKDK